MLTMQVNAAEKTTVAQVFTINTHGKTADWLKAYKLLSDRLHKLNPKSTAHVYETQFAESGLGLLDIVVENPSMAYIEQQRINNQGDPEVAKLIPALMATGMTMESGYQSLADVEKLDKQIGDDAESTRLFAERDKIGATIVSRTLHADVTPK